MTVKEYEALMLAKEKPKTLRLDDGITMPWIWMLGTYPIFYPCNEDTWIEYIPTQPGQKDGE